MSCCVKNCKNVRRFRPEDVTFHRFPKGVLFLLWLEAIGNDNVEHISWSPYRYICSDHFLEEDKYTKSGERVYIRPHAVPTLKLQNHFPPKNVLASTLTYGISSLSHNKEETTEGITSLRSLNRRLSQLSTSETSPFQSCASASALHVQNPFMKSHTSFVSTASLSQACASTASASKAALHVQDPLMEHTYFTVGASSLQGCGSSASPSHVQDPLMKSFTSHTSASTSSGTVRKRVKFIHNIHNYSLKSPSTYKRKYECTRSELKSSRQKLRLAKRSIKKLKLKVDSLKLVITDLKQKDMLSNNAVDHLKTSVEDVPKALMARYLKNIGRGSTTTETYPPELRQFAMTLQFYSSKAYDYVRNVFNLGLPDQSTIRRWCTNVNCEPGFTAASFEALKVQVNHDKLSNKKTICSLMLDEVSIKKRIDFDGKRVWGYVDCGFRMADEDKVAASEALVIMVVALNSSWKIPVAYFFIKSMTAQEKANVVQETLIRLHVIDVEITSVTCDGPSTHFSMFGHLGCNFSNINNLKTFFPHPVTKASVFAVFDACHMLKLMRNNFATLEKFRGPNGEIIEWSFISKLHDLQKQATLTAANKLNKKHMEWMKQKMKVSLAAQTLSGSVASALEFVTKDLNLPEFQGCEPTIEFIKTINRLFDMLNSRNPFGNGFKSPLRKTSILYWKPILLSTQEFLLNCTDNITGKLLCHTKNRTPFLGFAITIQSVCGIFENFVMTDYLSYLLTYKLSQDHLEIFFCCIRSRNGWNNNPSCMQFMASYRKLLLHAKISGHGGNCRVLDTTSVLKISSTGPKISNVIENDCAFSSLIDECEIPVVETFDVLDICLGIDSFNSNVLTYISGYVVKMLYKMIRCDICLETLTLDRHNKLANTYKLLERKNKGGLVIPSHGIVTICKHVETIICKVVKHHDNTIPRNKNLIDILVHAISQKLCYDLHKIFPNLQEHAKDNDILNRHDYLLLKATIRCYLKIRIHNLAKTYSQGLIESNIRQTLSKLILFHHQ